MQNEIYFKILGQAIRTVLRLASVYLGYIGITPDDQTTFVEVTVGILTPIVVWGLTEVWAYMVKRSDLAQKEAALLAPPSTSMAEVKKEAAKSVTNVSY